MCEGPHPFIPVPDTARVVMNMTHNAEKAMNVFHVRDTAGLDVATLQNIATAFESNDNNFGQAQRSATTSVDSIEVTALDLEDDLQILYTSNLPRFGENASPALPGGTTVATKLSSAFGGRSNQGRSYWVGLTEQMVAGNQILTGVVLALNEYYTELIAAVEGLSGTSQLVVVSYCSNGVWRTTGQAQRIIGVSTDNNIDSQRRRNSR